MLPVNHLLDVIDQQAQLFKISLSLRYWFFQKAEPQLPVIMTRILSHL
jgi:hypothetical protein